MIVYQKVTDSLTMRLTKESGVWSITFIKGTDPEHLQTPGSINGEDILAIKRNMESMLAFIKAYLKFKKGTS